jgi:hypothetical protein
VSKIINNFAGLNGHIWWIGVVENNNDPLKIGRCQVRIFGWHTADKSLIPTDDLPWALPQQTTNGSMTFSVPNFGDYVTGFFADSESGQFPIMTGVIPGIVTNGANGSTSNSGFIDPRTNEQIAQAPKPPAGQVTQQVGQPTTPPTARGVVANTAIDKTNNDLSHECQWAEDIRKNEKLHKFLVSVANQVREAIRAIKRTMGASDPSGNYSWIIDKMQSLANALKYIQKNIIQPIMDFETAVVEYVKLVKAIIDWLLNLSKEYVAMLKDCLVAMYKAIKDVMNDVLAESANNVPLGTETVPTDQEAQAVEPGTSFDDAVSAAKAVASEAGNTITSLITLTVQTASLPANVITTLTSPTDASTAANANTIMTSFFSTTSAPSQPAPNKVSP